jgi:hypothetical protein
MTIDLCGWRQQQSRVYRIPLLWLLNYRQVYPFGAARDAESKTGKWIHVYLSNGVRFSWTFFSVLTILHHDSQQKFRRCSIRNDLDWYIWKYSSQKKWEKYILESKTSDLKISSQYLILPPFFSTINFKTLGSVRICVRMNLSGNSSHLVK